MMHMSRAHKHNFIWIAALVVLAVSFLVSCSADSLMNSSEVLGKLANAGAGSAGEKYVKAAESSVSSFIEGYEANIDWASISRSVDSEDNESVSSVKFISEDAEKTAKSLLQDVVSDILKATEAGYSDKALRSALDSEYKGNAAEYFSYREMGSILTCTGFDMILGLALSAETLDMVKAYEIPFPLQGSDFLLLANKAVNMMFSHIGLVNKIKSGGSGSGSKFDIKTLQYIPDSITKHVGERTAPTVGDKIAFYSVFDVIDTLYKVLDKYKAQYPSETGDDLYGSLTADWILGQCSAELDNVMSELMVIGYIYDFNIDVASLVGNLISGS